jgi:hypothetical protein
MSCSDELASLKVFELENSFLTPWGWGPLWFTGNTKPRGEETG